MNLYWKRDNLFIPLKNDKDLKWLCLEEIAFEKGFITKEQLLEGAEKMKQTEYGTYLIKKYSLKYNLIFN